MTDRAYGDEDVSWRTRDNGSGVQDCPRHRDRQSINIFSLCEPPAISITESLSNASIPQTVQINDHGRERNFDLSTFLVGGRGGNSSENTIRVSNMTDSMATLDNGSSHHPYRNPGNASTNSISNIADSMATLDTGSSHHPYRNAVNASTNSIGIANLDSSSHHPYRNAVWGTESVMSGDDSIFDLMTGSNHSFFSSLGSTRMPTGLDAGGNGTGSANGVSSQIHDAARLTDWRTVASLCEQNPEAAGYIGNDGWTALHHACSRRCPYPQVVEAVIRAYPDALLLAEEKGWLPLHYACRFKAPKEVVELLLHMDSEKGRVAVTRPDRKGRSPLYYAVRYNSPPGVVGLLIEMDASAVLEEDKNADSPLALVWDDWAEKLAGKRTLQTILMDTGGNHNLDLNCSISSISFNLDDQTNLEERIQAAKLVRKRLERQPQALERWKKVNLFLKAAFGFPFAEDWEPVQRINAEEEKKDTREERKWRVLHAVCAIKCHYSLFLLAISLYPEQAFELDRNDLRPIQNPCNKSKLSSQLYPSNLSALHLAASSHSGGDFGRKVVSQLVSFNPGALKTVDTQGSTPLHRIAENSFKSDWSSDAVDEVYFSHPDAIQEVDSNGRLPLHRAAGAISYFDANLGSDAVLSRSVICRFLREHADGARAEDHFGCLPLHLLAQNGSRWDAQAQALYDANEDAVRHRTGVKLGNRLPLHLAAKNSDSDFTMIGKLVEYNPRGASQADRKGMYPIHLACESGHSWRSVQLIHEAFPTAVQQAEENTRGWHALHMAASSDGAEHELITKLVELDPEAASIGDTDGRLPLHLACDTKRNWDDGLSCLFSANPNAILQRDEHGMLPLHIVAFRYRCIPPSLGDAGPRVTDIRSRRLSRTSEALETERRTAKEKKEARELSNIYEILRADPSVL